MKRILAIAAVALLTGGYLAGARGPQSAPFVPPARPDYDGHLDRVKRSLPAANKFTAMTIEPYALVTDLEDEDLEIASRTISWTATHLRGDYFDRDPDRIIDIFLFKDKESYTANSREILHHDTPDPFGFTTPTTIAVNWAKGGGTLVREMVHPYMAANFPKCPVWFEQGLAALFEESTDRGGHLVGNTNWRLELLQNALRGKWPDAEGPAPEFKDLCAMNAETFNGKGNMPNVNTARYLLYYLQEHNLLRDYYQKLVKNQKQDPTGYDTLQKSLASIGDTDMTKFRRKWEGWVLTLTYP